MGPEPSAVRLNAPVLSAPPAVPDAKRTVVDFSIPKHVLAEAAPLNPGPVRDKPTMVDMPIPPLEASAPSMSDEALGVADTDASPAVPDEDTRKTIEVADSPAAADSEDTRQTIELGAASGGAAVPTILGLADVEKDLEAAEDDAASAEEPPVDGANETAGGDIPVPADSEESPPSAEDLRAADAELDAMVDGGADTDGPPSPQPEDDDDEWDDDDQAFIESVDTDAFEAIDDSVDGEVGEIASIDLHSVDLDGGGEGAVKRGGDEPELRPLPPPIPDTKASFVLRSLGQNMAAGQVIPLGEDSVLIGREDGDVQLSEDPFVSPRHARLSLEEDEVILEDLDSLNGVWRRVRDHAVIGDGDAVLVGSQILSVEAVSPPEEGKPESNGVSRMGIAAKGSRFRLVQDVDGHGAKDVFHVPDGGCRLGRQIGELVYSEDTLMSATHAVLMPVVDGLDFRDLSSRNGSWVRIRGSARLGVGDAFMIGQAVWRVGRRLD